MKPVIPIFPIASSNIKESNLFAKFTNSFVHDINYPQFPHIFSQYIKQIYPIYCKLVSVNFNFPKFH